MVKNITDKYPHLIFRKNWEITQKIANLLGQMEAFVISISNTPILPNHYQKLLNVSLIKGAQATTAIEGNTLTESEIEKIQQGIKLPPSKEYQEIEVRNILDAFNQLLKEVVHSDKTSLVTERLIKDFHELVGKNLGEHLDAIPGEFRTDPRFVGPYKCPDYIDIPALIEKLSEWLLREFHFDKGQSFSENIIQAIITHIYIEWIHPFGDGNGRTGRLIEFYILLRGGIPNIASHILSNHYNQTRSEYYRQLDLANKKRDLTLFIEYALVGFRDGLKQTLETIHESQIKITWQKFVYDETEKIRGRNTKVFKRRRHLMLDLPLDKTFTLESISLATPQIAKNYGGFSKRQLMRDLKELIDIGLLIKVKNLYRANKDVLNVYMAKKRESNIS